MSKKQALFLSAVGGSVFVALLIALLYNLCGPYRSVCKDVYEISVYLFSPLPFVFVLSLITYKMQEAVFQAWWRFAMWFVPLIMIVTYFLYSGHQQSGFGGVAQDAFYFAILVALYAIFILTSLIRIILAYRRSK